MQSPDADITVIQEAPAFDPAAKKKKPRKSVAFETEDANETATAESHSVSGNSSALDL